MIFGGESARVGESGQMKCWLDPSVGLALRPVRWKSRSRPSSAAARSQRSFRRRSVGLHTSQMSSASSRSAVILRSSVWTSAVRRGGLRQRGGLAPNSSVELVGAPVVNGCECAAAECGRVRVA